MRQAELRRYQVIEPATEKMLPDLLCPEISPAVHLQKEGISFPLF
jgi:hypothetical protein